MFSVCVCVLRNLGLGFVNGVEGDVGSCVRMQASHRRTSPLWVSESVCEGTQRLTGWSSAQLPLEKKGEMRFSM